MHENLFSRSLFRIVIWACVCNVDTCAESLEDAFHCPAASTNAVAGQMFLQLLTKSLQPLASKTAPLSTMRNRTAADMKRDLDKVRDIGKVEGKVQQDFERALEFFFPEWEGIPSRTEVHIVMCVFCAVLWFGLYGVQLYQNDRQSNTKVDINLKASAPSQDIDTDFVVVFHQPAANTESHQKPYSPSPRFITSRLEDDFPHCLQLSKSPSGSTLGIVRSALMKDLCDWLKDHGFAVRVFSSIDDDELYMCISLQSLAWINHYLERDRVNLQLQKQVVRKLEIQQPIDDPASSPAFMTYDLRIVARLHENGILNAKRADELYRVHPGACGGTIASSSDRIRIIYHELVNGFDLDAAKMDGIIVDWYPAHSVRQLEELKSTWANWSKVFDCGFVQPMHQIFEYFGARVAFNFAWNGFYCKALMAILPLAVLAEIWVLAVDANNATLNKHTRALVGPSIVLCIWSRFAQNQWNHEQAFFTEAWNIERNMEDQRVRPQFHGEFRPSLADGKIKEKYYPESLLFWRRCVSAIVTLALCLAVTQMIYLWMTLFSTTMGTFPSLCLAVQIKVCEFAFHVVAERLTDFENHKTYSGHFSSLLWKLFFFGSVNRYYSFLYLAWMQLVEDPSCRENYCLAALRQQVRRTLLLLILTRIAYVIISALRVNATLWKEKSDIQSDGQGHVPERPFVEEQSKYANYSIPDQINHMMRLVLSLGYVLLFGSISPLVIPLCLLEFVVELRACAFLLTGHAKRVVPWDSHLRGAWDSIINLLMRGGVIVTGCFIAAFGETFEGAGLLARLSCLLIWITTASVVWVAVDSTYETKDRETIVLKARRDRVITEIAYVGYREKHLADHTLDKLTPRTVEATDLITHESWAQIPHADGSPPIRYTSAASYSSYGSLGSRSSK